MGPRHCTKINRRLLPIKCHNFLYFAALACALPFRTIFAKQLGISATAVGVIFCIVPLLKSVTNPLFGFALDYFKKFRLTSCLIIICLALSHITMIFIPSKATANHNLTDAVDFHLRYYCSKEITSHDCDHSLILHGKYSLNKSETDSGDFMCDVQCSKNPKVEDLQQCHRKMSLDMRVRLAVSKCAMNVSLERGKIFITSEDGENVISAAINKSSIVQLKSGLIPASRNCSGSAFCPLDSFPEKIGDVRRLRDASSEAVKSYIFTTIPGLLSVDKNDRLYVEQVYNIKVLNKKNFVHSSCWYDFICKTKKCHHDLEAMDFDQEKSESEFISVQFWAFFFLIALSSAMLSAVIFLMDTVCYELLQDRRDEYGLQRLWGTIGWGIGALAGGYINQIASPESGEVDYTPSLCLLAVLLFVDLIPLYNLKVTELKYSSHIWKDVCFLFTKMDLVYNAIIVYTVGALSGFLWNYQFWFMEEIGSSQFLLGLSQALESVFEVPWFIFSGWIIYKIGHDHCNNITFLCIGLRYLCFVFMYNPWWSLPVGLIHGPTFGLFYASMTLYAKNNAPPGTEATVQSILHFCFEGIGIATGSFLGGVGLDKFGTRMSFLYAATISFSLLLVNLLMGFLFSRTHRISKQTPVPGCCT